MSGETSLNQRSSFEIVGRRKLWYVISLLVIGVGMYLVATHNMRWGIDFTGGGIFRYRFPRENVPPVEQQISIIQQVRQRLQAAHIETGTIQFSGRDELYIRTKARNDDEREAQSRRIIETLSTQYPGLEQLGSEVVGPVIGKDLTTKAIVGVTLGCILIGVWIWLRYNFMGEGLRYSVCGIVALIHDVLAMVGMFALACKLNTRIEADSAFVAALLTVVGYSINDSVVIFDRIRENLHFRRRDPFDRVVNDSLQQTMTRSINTVLTVLLTLFALLWFGGETIHSFVLALILGIVAGSYSSIFIAGSLLVSWKAYDERKRVAAAPIRKRDERAEPEPSPVRMPPAVERPAPAAIQEKAGAQAADAPAVEEAVAASAARPSPPAPTKTPRKKSKHGKRKRRY